MPICVYTRSRRDRCFKSDADYGYCAAKDLHYYGFRWGCAFHAPAYYSLPPLAARPHDIQLPRSEGFQGVLLADKGFIDGSELAKKKAVELLTPPRKNMNVRLPDPLRRIGKRWRKLIETVGSHLTERYHIANSAPMTCGTIRIA